MTHEQTRIVNYDVQPGDIIKIVAFAGNNDMQKIKCNQVKIKYVLLVL